MVVFVLRRLLEAMVEAPSWSLQSCSPYAPHPLTVVLSAPVVVVFSDAFGVVNMCTYRGGANSFAACRSRLAIGDVSFSRRRGCSSALRNGCVCRMCEPFVGSCTATLLVDRRLTPLTDRPLHCN